MNIYDMEDQPMRCTICNTILSGKYCHQCGQKSTGKRVSFRGMIGDVVSGIYSLERSVLGTFWHILVKPEKIIQNFWDGNRGYYHSPGKLLFYAAFIIGLHFAFIGNELLGVNLTFSTSVIPPQLLLLVLLIPVYALTSKLTFIKRKRRFLEHVIAMIYLFSTWIIVFIIADDLLSLALGDLIDEKMLLAFISILLIWNAKVHCKLKKWPQVLLYTIIQMGILIVMSALFVGLLYVFFREAIKTTST